MRRALWQVLLGGGAQIRPPAVFSLAGDSTAWQETGGNASLQYNVNGTFLWIRSQTNHRVLCPIPNNLGVAGSYIAQVSTQLPGLDTLSIPPTDMVLKTGVNDLTGNSPLATMKSDYGPILKKILDRRFISRLWLCPITPTSSSMNATLYQRRRDWNAWLAAIVSGDATATAELLSLSPGLSRASLSRLRILDVSFATAVDGDNPKTGYVVSDGLHHTALMAQGLASQISAYVNGVVAANPPVRTTTGDLYNASTNPHGTLLNNAAVNRGLFGGTTGGKTTFTGLTPTGNVATTMRLYRTAGSAPATLVAAKEGVRANGGDGQIITYTTSDVGLQTENIRLEYLGPDFGIPASAGITTGQALMFEGEIEILSNPNGALRAVQLSMFEQGNASNITVQDWISTSTSMTFPSGALGPYWFRCPLLVPQGATTYLNPQATAVIDATSGPISVSWVLRDWCVKRP